MKPTIASLLLLSVGFFSGLSPEFTFAQAKLRPQYLKVAGEYYDHLLSQTQSHSSAIPWWGVKSDFLTTTIQAKSSLWPLPTNAPQKQANLAYELSILHGMRVLAELTDRGSYRLASNRYLSFYLQQGFPKGSNRLAWGKANYFDFAKNCPVCDSSESLSIFNRPVPWEMLWDVSPERTKLVILDLESQLQPLWPVQASESKKEIPSADIPKISAVQIGISMQAFAFLYHKSGDLHWLQRARHCGDLLNQSQKKNQSTQGNLQWQHSFDQVTVAYCFMKSWREVAGEQNWGGSAKEMILAFDQSAFEDEEGRWNSVDWNAESHPIPCWESLRSSEVDFTEPSVGELGRIAAYVGGVTRDQRCLNIANRAFQQLERAPIPTRMDLHCGATGLGLALDLYDLQGEKRYLEFASKIAQALHKQDALRFAMSPTQTEQNSAGLQRSHVGDVLLGLIRLDHRTLRMRSVRTTDWTY
ncbi:Hypothetical protein PBC10988_6470 [Planctomycetales bacterium 10988]|nr:Hypothetical protein PBC10988_6470 [Planctomycetales bacterium 10988]